MTLSGEALTLFYCVSLSRKVCFEYYILQPKPWTICPSCSVEPQVLTVSSETVDILPNGFEQHFLHLRHSGGATHKDHLLDLILLENKCWKMYLQYLQINKHVLVQSL